MSKSYFCQRDNHNTIFTMDYLSFGLFQIPKKWKLQVSIMALLKTKKTKKLNSGGKIDMMEKTKHLDARLRKLDGVGPLITEPLPNRLTTL